MGVGVDDGALVADGQLGGVEVVDVMHGANAPVDGIGADAVLRVHHVVAGRVEGIP